MDFASADCGVSLCSIVLKLVPASDPSRPCEANAASPAVVSSMLSPVDAATRPV